MDQKGPKVAVFGDLVLDRYTFGEVSRISPEAPVPVLEVKRREQRLGGAGNVVLNLCALNVNCTPFGRVGKDLHGKVVVHEFEQRSLSTSGIVHSAELPTITKHRLVARNQQILRVDEETIAPMPRDEEELVIQAFLKQVDDFEVVVLSDYGKGFLSDDLIKKVIQISKEHGKPIVVDPKSADFSRYRGATTITPNFKEAQLAAPKGRTLNDIAETLMDHADLSFLMLTRSEDGISHFSYENGELKQKHFPVQVQEVTDVTGAGDTVVAVTALAMAEGWPVEKMCRACNLAGGYVVGHFGAATIPRAELNVLLGEKS